MKLGNFFTPYVCLLINWNLEKGLNNFLNIFVSIQELIICQKVLRPSSKFSACFWDSVVYSFYYCFSSSTGSANKRQRDANSTTLMLIVVIAIFLTVEIPLMVITALHTISSRYRISFKIEMKEYE